MTERAVNRVVEAEFQQLILLSEYLIAPILTPFCCLSRNSISSSRKERATCLLRGGVVQTENTTTGAPLVFLLLFLILLVFIWETPPYPPPHTQREIGQRGLDQALD